MGKNWSSVTSNHFLALVFLPVVSLLVILIISNVWVRYLKESLHVVQFSCVNQSIQSSDHLKVLSAVSGVKINFSDLHEGGVYGHCLPLPSSCIYGGGCLSFKAQGGSSEELL